MAKIPHFSGRNNSFTWEFHDEAILVALEEHKRQVQGTRNYCSLWVIEDDVAFSGTWNELFDKYGSRKADLLGSQPRMNSLDDDRYGSHCSKTFLERIVPKLPQGKVTHHSEMVVRYSAEFLKEIALQLADGVHAHSEYGTPSLAKALGYR